MVEDKFFTNLLITFHRLQASNIYLAIRVVVAVIMNNHQCLVQWPLQGSLNKAPVHLGLQQQQLQPWPLLLPPAVLQVLGACRMLLVVMGSQKTC